MFQYIKNSLLILYILFLIKTIEIKNANEEIQDELRIRHKIHLIMKIIKILKRKILSDHLRSRVALARVIVKIMLNVYTITFGLGMYDCLFRLVLDFKSKHIQASIMAHLRITCNFNEFPLINSKWSDLHVINLAWGHTSIIVRYNSQC